MLNRALPIGALYAISKYLKKGHHSVRKGRIKDTALRHNNSSLMTILNGFKIIHY